MKAHIFENLKDLNEFLANVEARRLVDVKYQSQIVSKTQDTDGKETYGIVDRFLVLVK